MQIKGADRNRLVLAGAGTALIVMMGLALLAGFRLATRIRSSIGSLQTASELQTYPRLINQELTALRQRLETREYTGKVHVELVGTARRFDHDIDTLKRGPEARSASLQEALALWSNYGTVLGPVLAFSGEPYTDTDAGSTFSARGRIYYSEVRQAQLLSRGYADRLHGQLAAVTLALQARTSAAAARLRGLLSGGLLAALALALAAAYFQMTRARSQRAAREAQEQTRDILNTVREGFFLLDSDYRIGSVWSDALTRMFGRNDFAGLSFEKLLEGRVSPGTLATAMKYIKLLWGDRAHENLMKSINPLGQLEVTMDNGRGNRETRYLEFDFHRVTGAKGVKYVLCSVGDITSNVLLAKELQDAQENASAQLDMMLGMMHVDPLQLGTFLEATEAGLQHINSILKQPARTDAEFRRKLGGLFRELHTIKGEASALNLLTIAQRVHSLEDMIGELKKKPELSGNDFLPMVLKLDELLAHLRGVREMATRLSTVKPPQAQAADAATEATGTQPAAPSAGRSAEDLGPTLHALADRLAQEHRKRFRLTLAGLSDVPARYRATVKDCVIQMLRNAAVHGIEASEVRRTRGKPDVGAVRAEFRASGEGYELVFEDDGAGISTDTLKQAAVRKNLISAEEAAQMDARAAMTLIFRPGFSTQDEVTLDAGRGVGMDVVARSVYELGGKIGVSTNPGHHTRFRIVLPALEATSSAVA
jgi:two-component system chemotaxis sensor kinase CheA